MIDFILHELRRQGAVVTDEMGTAAMVAAHETYGGERLYVPKLPKLQTAVRIQRAVQSGVRSHVDIAAAIGVNESTVRRVRRR